MADNFDFLKKFDKKLYSIILDAQNLFCDGYFNQSAVNVRIFGEKLAQKILPNSAQSTFDDTLNCLKDGIKTQRDKELVEDLFFIKQQGNKAAHGETLSSLEALETIKRAFEASINYCYCKSGQEEINKLIFDTELLINNKKTKTIEQKLIDAKKDNKETLTIDKNKKLEKKKEIKEKIKQARKNLKQNINKPIKTKKRDNTLKKRILFIIFVIVSIFLLSKILFPF